MSAAQFARKLPAGGIRDTAIETYVEAVHVWHPEAAARLAAKAQDPALRERAVEKALTLWLELDPDSARRWLADTEFPGETRRRWISLKPSAEF